MRREALGKREQLFVEPEQRRGFDLGSQRDVFELAVPVFSWRRVELGLQVALHAGVRCGDACVRLLSLRVHLLRRDQPILDQPFREDLARGGVLPERMQSVPFALRER